MLPTRFSFSAFINFKPAHPSCASIVNFCFEQGDSLRYAFYASSTRALVLYLLDNPNSIAQTIFFFEASVPQPLRSGLNHILLSTPNYKNSLSLLLSIWCARIQIKLFLYIIKNKLEFRGTDNQIYSPLFYKRKNYIAYEEGAGEFVHDEHYYLANSRFGSRLNRLTYLCKSYISYGCIASPFRPSSYVTRKCLSKILPYNYRNDYYVINVFQALISLDKNSQVNKYIKHIIDENLQLLQNDSALLALILLQPFAAHGIMSEEEEEAFYQKIFEKIKIIDPDMAIVCKLHPQQIKPPIYTANYKLINGVIPAEFLLVYADQLSVVAGGDTATLDDFKTIPSVLVIQEPVER
jgi:hypothetical protein